MAGVETLNSDGQGKPEEKRCEKMKCRILNEPGTSKRAFSDTLRTTELEKVQSKPTTESKKDPLSDYRVEEDKHLLNKTSTTVVRDVQLNDGHIMKPDVSSTLFVPASRNSLLFKLICEKEYTVAKNMDWSVKVLEQPGIPLLNSFIHKFPISDGCPKGELCTLCSNDCKKCSIKGAIYRIFCVNCQVEITGDNGYAEGQNIPTYVGETSCPVRERISEHWKNLRNWNRESVMLQHWMKYHGTDTQYPDFKF